MLRTISLDSVSNELGKKSSRRKSQILRGPHLARIQPAFEQLERRQLMTLNINPTFAANITADPNAATIMATINRAIAAYESTIADNVTVDITFQEGGGLGGSSGGFQYGEKYKDYYDALGTHSTSANDTTAIASLPNQTNDPVNNQDRIDIRSPLARALGFNAPSQGGTAGDGTITLNTAICNLDRTSVQDPAKYDLQAVVSHEIDEILGFGSAIGGPSVTNGDPVPTGRVMPDDLFRYDETGARTFDTQLATQAYFSIDGGTTRLARFNQTGGGDWGDWFSTAAHTPQIQDAFGTAGATPNLGAELTRFDILGYSLSTLNAPSITAPAGQGAVEGSPASINLGSFTDPDAAPWGVIVNWGDGTPNTTYFLNSAGARRQAAYVRRRRSLHGFGRRHRFHQPGTDQDLRGRCCRSGGYCFECVTHLGRRRGQHRFGARGNFHRSRRQRTSRRLRGRYRLG